MSIVVLFNPLLTLIFGITCFCMEIKSSLISVVHFTMQIVSKPLHIDEKKELKKHNTISDYKTCSTNRQAAE